MRCGGYNPALDEVSYNEGIYSCNIGIRRNDRSSRKEIEVDTGKPVITSKNASELNHVVANVESSLTESGISSKMEISHLSSPNAWEWFKSVSADIWTIANNHILDCGESGMTDTIDAAKKCGAVTVGAGKNIDEASKYITLDVEGGIGIFAVTYKRAEFIRATENAPGCYC